MATSELELFVRGEKIKLLPKRAVLIPKSETLLVADLHWGKTASFRKSGIPIPDGVFFRDLERLGGLIQTHNVKRLVVLGDLVHDRDSLSSPILEEIERWRKKYPITFILVEGNHDRYHLHLPSTWQILRYLERAERPFIYRHHPMPTPEYFTWCGHWHPGYRLKAHGDSLRLPCFYMTPNLCVIPAFSQFTGHLEVERKFSARIFAIVEETVVEV